MPDVKVYSTSMCQYCRLVKAFLDKKGVAYDVLDVGTDHAAAKEMVELTGQFGVPVTVVGDEVIIGFDTARLNELFGEGRGEGEYDLVIIGAGPAGLTAGVYAARKKIRSIIISENIGGQALESWAIENYMGYRMVAGQDLMQKFEEQVKKEEIQIELDSISSISDDSGVFTIKTVSDQTFMAKCLIITSGVRPRWLGLPDEKRFIGRGESVCATCDGPLFAGKSVAVVGGGNSALMTVIEMSRIAKEVYLIVRSHIRADPVYADQYKALSNVHTLMNYAVSGLEGREFLSTVVVSERDTAEVRRLPVEGLFLAIGHDANTGFLDGFVNLEESGEIVIDQNCHTSREGVFAAGDVTNVAGKQIIIAAGDGAKAALEAYRYLMEKGV